MPKYNGIVWSTSTQIYIESMDRKLLALLLVLLLFASAPALAGDRERPELVRVYLVQHSSTPLVGELIAERENGIEIYDLHKLGKRLIPQSEVKRVEHSISEQSAATSVGLPTFVAWKIAKATASTKTVGKAKSTIAVFPVLNASGKRSTVTDAFTEDLIAGLVTAGVPVVERTRLSETLAELAIQQTDFFSAESAQRSASRWELLRP